MYWHIISAKALSSMSEKEYLCENARQYSHTASSFDAKETLFRRIAACDYHVYES